MDTKYTDVSQCPEHKLVVTLRLFEGNLSYLAYFSEAIKETRELNPLGGSDSHNPIRQLRLNTLL